MDSQTLHELGGSYVDDINGRNWNRDQEKELPDNPRLYTEVMVKAGVLPSEGNVNGFVFYSASANQSSIEYAVADYLNGQMGKTSLTNKTMVYMADIFGTSKETKYKDANGVKHDITVFIPGFEGATKQYPNVEVLRLSADAMHIPLENGSVNVIWDRLGALWHEIENAGVTSSPYVKEVVESLLNEYKRVLKEDGVVVIDAADTITGAPYSTYTLTRGVTYAKKEVIPKMDLADFGWNVSFAGDGENKIAILKPVKGD
jgi:hypothetical protein